MNQSTHTDRPLTIDELRAQQAPPTTPAEAEIAGEPSTSTDIALRVEADAGIVLTDKQARDQFYSYIKREVESFVPDISSDKGRKAIASLAYSVSRSKTLIEKAKAGLKSEWLEKSRKVDSEWRAVERELDTLRDKVRQPLTDWEESEERRKSVCQATITRLNAAAVVAIDATVESVHATLADLRIIPTDEDSMQEYSSIATEAKNLAVRSLSTALARLEKEETDRAELAKYRAAHEARVIAEMQAAAHEEEERLKREESERQRIAEEKRQKDEQDRIQQAAKDAEDKARQEVEKTAREAAEQRQREHDAEIARLKADQDKRDADARREREEAAAKHDAEMNRLAKVEADRKAEEARLKKIADDKAAEDARLAKNKKHRTELMTASKLALIQFCGIDEDRARAVVKMIIDEKIPNIRMSFTV